MIEISIILITRNQDWNIRRLIESVIKETSGIKECEILLVDSASTDRTTEIACLYPIDVIRLQPGQPLSAAAGRYVGYLHTTGMLILFLDGDMGLSPDWLPQALNIIEQFPKIGCITGNVIDRPIDSTDFPGMRLVNEVYTGGFNEISTCGGASLYRRAVLDQVGPFNPFLASDEEPELCLRIRHAGHKIMRLDMPIVYHYTAPIEKIATVLGRRQRKLYCGLGQNLRYYWKTPLLWSYLAEHKYIYTTTLGILAGVAALFLSIITGRWYWISFWALFVVGIIFLDAFRKRSFYQTFYSLVKRLIVWEAVLHGLFMRRDLPESYPALIDVIKKI